MALKKLMDSGGNLSYQSGIVGTPPTLPAPSTKVKAGGHGAFFGPLNFTIPAGVNNGTCQVTPAFAGTINPSTSKVKSGGQAAVLDGDSVTYSSIPGTLLSNGNPCTLSITVTANASQSKVKGQ